MNKNKPDDGGQAYPRVAGGVDGMSLIDKFADSVLRSGFYFYNTPTGYPKTEAEIAKRCYEIASAMIKEGQKYVD